MVVCTQVNGVSVFVHSMHRQSCNWSIHVSKMSNMIVTQFFTRPNIVKLLDELFED